MNKISSQGGTNRAMGASEDSIGGKMGKGIYSLLFAIVVFVCVSLFSFECMLLINVCYYL